MIQLSSETDIRLQLLAILGDLKGMDASKTLECGDDFMSEFNLDSLDAVELTVRLSTDFGVEFGADPDDLDAMESFTALVALVHRRQSKQ